MTSTRLVALVVAAALPLLPVGSRDDAPKENESTSRGWSDLKTQADDEKVSAEARAERATWGGGVFEAGVAGGPPTERFWRADADKCLAVDVAGFSEVLRRSCEEGTELAFEGVECAVDERQLQPLYRQSREVGEDGTVGEWGEEIVLNEGGCVTPADLLAEAGRAFASLPIEASPVVVQPPDGWTLVNVPTITYTHGESQVMGATLLGVPVEIRATPVEFSWDYADGSVPLVTSDPGAAYPEHTVHHTYERAVESVTIRLTTSWSGQFRIVGSPTWTDVPGTATTTSAAEPLRVYEARSRLVEDLVD